MAKTTDRGLENREIALDILMEVLEKGNFIHLVLGQALQKYQYLEKQDRAFITRLAEGTAERLLTLDAVIDRYSKIKTEKQKPLIRCLLRMSVYQILYMDRVPDSAACNEAVKLAAKRRFAGLKGFVNGLLRTISREKESLSFEEPSLRLSLPAWIYQMWEKDLGREQAEAVGESFLRESPTWIRCNESRASREEILASLRGQGVTVEETALSRTSLAISGYDHLEGLEAFCQGWIQVQDVTSALVGELAAPKKESHVIDVCAAPGGKSIHLADMLKGTGWVDARDLTWQKVSLIEENAARCGLTNLGAQVWDARELDPSTVETADIVIADLPCSGLGIIGKKPDIKYRVKPEDLKELAALQREILSVVWQYVKPGGILVYSTCTVDRMENEENARWFEEQFPFVPVDLRERLPGFFEKGSREDTELKEGRIQFLPGIHPYDGFFISVFRREGCL